mgnify:CR=1 FL=1
MEVELKDLLGIIGELYVEKTMLEKSGGAVQSNIQQLVVQYEQRIKEMNEELALLRSQAERTFNSDYVSHLEDTVQKLNARIKELESGRNHKNKKRNKLEPASS